MQDARYTDLARAALRTMRRQVERYRPAMTSIGAYEGWGGIIYTLTHLATLWREPALLAEAESMVPELAGHIDQDEQFGIAGGAAGGILALAGLFHAAPSKRVCAAAVHCGELILNRAQPAAPGVTWPRAVRAHECPQIGFSRGAAGIAYALLELAELTRDERFRVTALDAITHERSMCAGGMDIYPEPLGTQRSDDQGVPAVLRGGALGIGLARLRSLPYVDDAAVRAEIDAALAAAPAAGSRPDHSLCHGDLGSLDLLLTAAETLGQPCLRSQVGRMAAGILHSAAVDGWHCGVPLGVETPGLMTGLAGIGYQLLRVAEPARVPSVLALARPIGDNIWPG